jgi:hypothetical protein
LIHVANNFAVVLDANVLYPFRKRDILLRFAHAGSFAPVGRSDRGRVDKPFTGAET